MHRYFTFLFFLFSFSIFAQKIWYFGNGAGLDFSSGKAKPIHSGKLFTLEGCATACDDKGRLLFYSDGVTVWNRFHRVMENGTDLNGSYSSAQSAIIVPQPGAREKYFLFTTDEKAGAKGLCYSSIDCSSDEGLVVKKNIRLLSLCTEQITAVRHVNGKDIWVISHQWNSNNFFVFPVTEQGVGTPVITSVGFRRAETGAGQNRETIGLLRASSNGKKIASTTSYRPANNLEIFDFDNSNGKISNGLPLSLAGNPYGICFSPDDTKLYVSFLKGKAGILQYVINDKSIVEVASNTDQNAFGGLKMGPDGKIYIARTGKFLDVIELPNETGALCKYKMNAVDLSPASCNFSLPNTFVSVAAAFLYSPYSETLNTVDCSEVIENPFSGKGQLVTTEISVCENSYVLNAKNPGAAYQWSTFSLAQKITVDSSGLYRVVILKDGCQLADSVRIKFRKDLAVFYAQLTFNPFSEFVNPEFNYSIEDVSMFTLTVYDRKKRRIIFKTKKPTVKWNGRNKKGKIVPGGDYFWSVTYKPNCPKNAEIITKQGKVTVQKEIKGKF